MSAEMPHLDGVRLSVADVTGRRGRSANSARCCDWDFAPGLEQVVGYLRVDHRPDGRPVRDEGVRGRSLRRAVREKIFRVGGSG
jgi:hypothetical protein